MYDQYGDKGLWGPYGFYDSFNPTLNWVNSDYIGIDQGPIVIMIENYRTGLVWEYCMKDPIIQKGLDRLGFKRRTKRDIFSVSAFKKMSSLTIKQFNN
jgi:hypothetical protein